MIRAMEIESIHHVALPVSDLERATAFYRETSIADLLVEPGRKTRA